MKDFLGVEVQIDDYFAYPLIIGRSANMAIFQYKGVTENGSVRGRPINRSYSYGQYNDSYKYKKWDRKTDKWVDMTDAEKAKVDNRTSALSKFEERAIILKNFNEADYK